MTGNPTEAWPHATAVANWPGADPNDWMCTEGTAPSRCEWVASWQVLKPSEKFSDAAPVAAKWRRWTAGGPAAEPVEDVDEIEHEEEDEGRCACMPVLGLQARPLGRKAAKTARHANTAV